MGRTWVVENTWVCSSCGTKNRGRDMACAECGNAKEAHERYDTSGNRTAEAVTDADLLRDARAGANWTCAYCGFQQRNMLSACESCGADRGGTLSDDPRRDETSASPAASAPPGASAAVSSRWKTARRVLLILGTPVALFALWMLYLLFPYEVDAAVSDTEWTYTRVLQQRQQNHGSGWDETVRARAFDQSCTNRFRENVQCNPHDCNCHDVTDYCSYSCNCQQVCSDPVCTTTCSDNGNGYSTCSESCSGGGCSQECDTCEQPCGSHTECDTCWDECPVYDDWCEYEYYTWPEIDREVTRGHGATTRWGNRFQPDAAMNQRVETTEEYRVVFTEDDDSWSIAPDSLSEFQRYREGSRWTLEVTHAGDCTPLHPSDDES